MLSDLSFRIPRPKDGITSFNDGTLQWWIEYRSSSCGSSAVLRLGILPPSFSPRRVLTFQAATFNGMLLVWCFRLLKEMPCCEQLPNQGWVEWTMFGPPFLGPSPVGVSRAVSKEDCLVILGAAEGNYHSDPSIPTTIYLTPPDVQVIDYKLPFASVTCPLSPIPAFRRRTLQETGTTKSVPTREYFMVVLVLRWHLSHKSSIIICFIYRLSKNMRFYRIFRSLYYDVIEIKTNFYILIYVNSYSVLKILLNEVSCVENAQVWFFATFKGYLLWRHRRFCQIFASWYT